MDLIKQTSPTTCGQCCLAMLLDISVGYAIQLVGHHGTTDDADMLRVIREICFPAEDEFDLGYPPNDRLCLVYHGEPNGSRGHWTVSDYGRTLDPACKGNKLWPATKYLIIE